MWWQLLRCLLLAEQRLAAEAGVAVALPGPLLAALEAAMAPGGPGLGMGRGPGPGAGPGGGGGPWGRVAAPLQRVDSPVSCWVLQHADQLPRWGS